MNGQRIDGVESVTYTPVEAYGISTFAEGIISGGNGGEETVVKNTRFFWVYDPGNPQKSGFTGSGKWYCGEPHTPLAGITEDELLQEFSLGTRTNLNNEFVAWQQLVSSQLPGQTDYVKDFMEMVGFDCFSTNG